MTSSDVLWSCLCVWSITVHGSNYTTVMRWVWFAVCYKISAIISIPVRAALFSICRLVMSSFLLCFIEFIEKSSWQSTLWPPGHVFHVVCNDALNVLVGKLWSRSVKVAYNLLHKLGTKQEPLVRPGDRVSKNKTQSEETEGWTREFESRHDSWAGVLWNT